MKSILSKIKLFFFPTGIFPIRLNKYDKNLLTITNEMAMIKTKTNASGSLLKIEIIFHHPRLLILNQQDFLGIYPNPYKFYRDIKQRECL